ncbi:hypothetical protein CR513_57386, partial [Mucuna pruriens]
MVLKDARVYSTQTFDEVASSIVGDLSSMDIERGTIYCQKNLVSSQDFVKHIFSLSLYNVIKDFIFLSLREFTTCRTQQRC